MKTYMGVIFSRIHVKYVRNLPSLSLHKCEIGEADWDLFDKATKIERNASEFSSLVAAYEYLESLLMCGAIKSNPKAAGKSRRLVVPWWNKDCELNSKSIVQTIWKTAHFNQQNHL